MSKPSHLTLVVNNSVAKDKDELDYYHDIDKVFIAVDDVSGQIDFDSVLKHCVTFGAQCSGYDYWDFIDTDIAYFDFLFHELPQNELYDLNLRKANFFVHLVYLSFLTRIGAPKNVEIAITTYLDTLPADLKKMVLHHSLTLSSARTISKQNKLISDEAFSLMSEYADRTSEVFSS